VSARFPLLAKVEGLVALNDDWFHGTSAGFLCKDWLSVPVKKRNGTCAQFHSRFQFGGCEAHLAGIGFNTPNSIADGPRQHSETFVGEESLIAGAGHVDDIIGAHPEFEKYPVQWDD